MTERLRIGSTARLPPAALAAFEPLGEIEVTNGPGDGVLSRMDLLIVRAERVDEEFLAAAPRLRAIARTGTGLDSIDVAAATRRRIPLVYAPDSGTVAIAEGTLTLILASLKRLRELTTVVTDSRWQERYDHDILDIVGTTLGVIGFGRIGREVARLAGAVGMNVIVFDPQARVMTDGVEPRRVVAKSLEEVFAEADVITLHCPLNERTRNLVDRELLERAKPGAILVNASRGGLVAGDEVLLDALDSGRLSTVALDVFVSEPPSPASPLLRDPRVICTPHVVGLTRTWNRQVFESLARDVTRLLNGHRPTHIANPEVLSGTQC